MEGCATWPKGCQRKDGALSLREFFLLLEMVQTSGKTTYMGSGTALHVTCCVTLDRSFNTCACKSCDSAEDGHCIAADILRVWSNTPSTGCQGAFPVEHYQRASLPSHGRDTKVPQRQTFFLLLLSLPGKGQGEQPASDAWLGDSWPSCTL